MTITAFPLQATGVSFGQEPFYRLLDHLVSPGVATGLEVTQRAAGVNMSVDVAPGDAYVAITNGGKRLFSVSASSNSGTPGTPGTDWLATFTAAHSTLPRIDRVVAQVQDNIFDSSTQYRGVLKVVAGTPSAGATLANLAGAAALPANCTHIRYVLVPAGSTAITNANISAAPTLRATIGGTLGVRSAGKSIITAEQTSNSAAYAAMSTPDRVSGIVLPTGGILRIGYQALWSVSAGTGYAGIFIGPPGSLQQLKIGQPNGVPETQFAQTTGTARAHLFTQPTGLSSAGGTSAASNVTTGQLVGAAGGQGGMLDVFLDAGVYDIEVRFFNAGGGAYSVSDRHLWVEAVGF